MSLDPTVLAKIQERHPDITKDATVEQMLDKLGVFDVISAKRENGVWQWSMSGGSINTDDSKKNAMADLLAAVITDQQI